MRITAAPDRDSADASTGAGRERVAYDQVRGSDAPDWAADANANRAPERTARNVVARLDPTVNVVDVTAEVARPTSVDELNRAFRAAEAASMSSILGGSGEPQPSHRPAFTGHSQSSRPIFTPAPYGGSDVKTEPRGVVRWLLHTSQ